MKKYFNKNFYFNKFIGKIKRSEMASVNCIRCYLFLITSLVFITNKFECTKTISSNNLFAKYLSRGMYTCGADYIATLNKLHNLMRVRNFIVISFIDNCTIVVFKKKTLVSKSTVFKLV